jgi:hypothetical protein
MAEVRVRVMLKRDGQAINGFPVERRVSSNEPLVVNRNYATTAIQTNLGFDHTSSVVALVFDVGTGLDLTTSALTHEVTMLPRSCGVLMQNNNVGFRPAADSAVKGIM